MAQAADLRTRLDKDFQNHGGEIIKRHITGFINGKAGVVEPFRVHTAHGTDGLSVIPRENMGKNSVDP